MALADARPCVGIEIGARFIRGTILAEGAASRWQRPTAVTFTDIGAFAGDASKTVLWELPRVRALVCGTCDPSCALRALRDNPHILERIVRSAGMAGHTVASPRGVLQRECGPEPAALELRYRMEDQVVTGVELYQLLVRELYDALGIDQCGCGAVVCVPVDSNDEFRQKTRDALYAAGSPDHINVLRVINEPTAVCISLGLAEDNDLHAVSIAEVGPDYLRTTLILIEDGIFEVVYHQNHPMPCLSDHTQSTEECHQAVCEFIKADCTASLTAYVIGSIPFYDGTIGSLAKLVVYSSLGQDVTGLVEMLQAESGAPPDTVLAADPFCVSRGAAIQAGILSNPGDDDLMCVFDVTPLARGVETADGLMHVVSARNTTIPQRMRRIFTTREDMQKSVRIRVVEGQRALVQDGRELGRLDLHLTHPCPRGVSRIEIEFDTDANGTLNVRASELTGSGSATVAIEEQRMSLDELVQMIQDGEEHYEADQNAIAAIELDLEAKRNAWRQMTGCPSSHLRLEGLPELAPAPVLSITSTQDQHNFPGVTPAAPVLSITSTKDQPHWTLNEID